MCSHLLSINSSHWLIILGGGIKLPSETSEPLTKLSMSRQSSTDCRRESSANLVPGCSVLRPALVLAVDMP